MPELPEVETIRLGLERYCAGRTIAAVQTFHPRVDRTNPGALERAQGQRIEAVVRRGKYLWFLLEDAAIVAHLRMSGQFRRFGAGVDSHLRARFVFTDGEPLDFLDQRTFGYLHYDELIPTPDGWAAGAGSMRAQIPASASAVARDLLDPHVDVNDLARNAKLKRTRIKSLLLDQSFASGVGNIYADEALWYARLNGVRPASSISQGALVRLFDECARVVRDSIAQGGTSFDDLYVNLDGGFGSFAGSLRAYGRSGQPCARCGKLLVREAFMGRSSTYCPHCQARRK